MAFGRDAGVTPTRKTHIFVDCAEYSQLEPPFQIQRALGQIASGDFGERVDVLLAESVGWQLKAIQDDHARARQTTDGQTGLVLAGAGPLGGFLYAPRIVTKDTWKKTPGVTYAAGVAATGDPYFQDQYHSGDTPDDAGLRLAADQAAFPGPSHPFEASELDRKAVSASADSTDTYKEYRFTLLIHDARQTDFGHFASFYFAGPAGTQRDFIGYGQYCLMILSDGKAYLCERGEYYDRTTEPDPTKMPNYWVTVAVFRYNPAGVSGANKVQFDVRALSPNNVPTPYKYGSITIKTLGVEQKRSPSGTDGRSNTFISRGPKEELEGSDAQSGYLYAVPREEHGYTSTEVPGRSKPCQVRVDIARGLRPNAQVRQLTYDPDGTLRDDPFDLKFYPCRTKDIVIEFKGAQPPGTAITVQLFEVVDSKTFNEIVATSSTTWSATFPTSVDIRYYFVKFTLTSADGTKTPILQGYSARRDGTRVLTDPTEFEVDNGATTVESPPDPPVITLARTVGSDVSIAQPEADPSRANASFMVDDLVGMFDRIKVRGMLNTRIETEYDPLDSSKRSILFRGRIVAPRGVKKGRGSAYPGQWRQYYCDAVGPWQALTEAISTVMYNFNDVDPNDLTLKRPWKVTDAVRAMLGWAGFPPEMIDVPDLELRFWANGSNDTRIEPFSNIGDVILLYVRQWLGMRLVFDDNAGDYGMWRVRYAPLPPYNYFCHFVTTGPGAGKSAILPESYGLLDGRPIVPILAGTLTTWKKPLEFNKLTLTTTGLAAGRDGATRFKASQTFYNTKSFNFFDLDPSHPMFPDPEHPDYSTKIIPAWVIDPTLGGDANKNDISGVLDRFGRRMMAIAGCTKTGLKFRAAIPLALEEDDPLSTVPRMPQYYDAVTVDGATFLIRTCNPSYKHDRLQFANWELEAPREDFL